LKKEEFCYWCGEMSTSKEHVPPKCLFPANKDVKDILEQSFRNHLITVPSCAKHNMEKSNDDEYLMSCLSGRVGNNYVGFVHNATKVNRARERNSKLIKVESNDVIKLGEKEFPVQWIVVDTYRLIHSFESIARALYFHTRNKIFTGECKIISGIFIHGDDKNGSLFNLRSTKLIESEKLHWKTEVQGENPDIFTYQFSPIDGFGIQTLSMNFFQSTKVYAIFSDLTPEKMDELKPKFLNIVDDLFGDLNNK